MGKLHGRALADADAGRNALDDGPLRRPDQGRRAFPVIVVFQVQGGDQALAGFSARRPFDEDQPLLRGEEAAGEIIGHCFPDPADPGVFLRFGLVQEDFGIDQVKGRGGVPHEAGRFFPISRLGRILVAGDDRPFRQVEPGLGKKNFGDAEGDGFVSAHGSSWFVIDFRKGKRESYPRSAAFSNPGGVVPAGFRFSR